MDKPYYLAYEERYQKAFAAGVERWGHRPDDEILLEYLTKFVEGNGLRGKRVIEFACGEGAGAEILCRLGCIYHGVDIAPSAVAKTKAALVEFTDATVEQLDMVNGTIHGTFDAAIDLMGFHMLILDRDRSRYLQNAIGCLNPGSPMLFFRQGHRPDAPEDIIETMEQWLALTGDDYTTPQLRTARQNGMEIEVNLPLVPARGRNKEGYIAELERAGFAVEGIDEMDMSEANPYSVSIFARKP